MKAEQVDQALKRKFIDEEQRLVFWHDANGEFADYIAEGLDGDLQDVRILEVAKIGGLSAKLLLEREAPEDAFLVYSSGETLGPEEDWLLDIRLYSARFYAEAASIWLQELGLTSLRLREHLKERSGFLGSQDRLRKLKRLVNAGDDEATLDAKMMAVLVNAKAATPFAILQALCHGHVRGGRFDLGSTPEALVAFAKMGLQDGFWELMKRDFGFHQDKPSVAALLRQLFVSELFNELNDARIDALAHFRLPRAGSRNAVVFLTQWRDSSAHARSYDACAGALAKELGIRGHLADLPFTSFEGLFTFWQSEQAIAWGLKEHVLSHEATLDAEAIKAVAAKRLTGHWLAGPGRDAPERRATADAYEAIVAAAEFFDLYNREQRVFRFETPAALLMAYRERLYGFDRLYRCFNTKARRAMGLGWDLLKPLSEALERTYDQGFLQTIGLEWSRLLDEGFLSSWELDDIPAQRDFYDDVVRTHLHGSTRKRAFVIISDAFRYEAAKELTETLNGRYRMNAEIGAMLSGLPSVTSLGMASLLPRKSLAYDATGDILVDGHKVASTEARNKHLVAHEGMACLAKDLMSLKLDDAREFTRGARVVYIYHDVIDDRLDGDNKETGSFEAVDACINELGELVQFCVNKLNAAKVWVTADHGFLFQESSPHATDKSKLSHKPAQTLKANKRYVIGRDLGTSPEAHHGSCAHTAGAAGEMEFWVPRGSQRFHFMGGARFVHGGAMPQEVMVPVVTVTQLRGKHSESSRSTKVAVQILGSKHKITTPKYRFEFIQTESVSERRRPLVAKAAVYYGGDAVTSIETITFDSASNDINERKRTVLLELSKGSHSKTRDYRLVLRDAESEAEVLALPVIIDRSFDDDF